MKLIKKEFAETAISSFFASVNPYEEASMNKLLKDLFDKRTPNHMGSFRVPFSLTDVVLKAVQEMIDYDCNIKFSNIVVDNLKLNIGYKTNNNCRFVLLLQDIIAEAQGRIDQIVHQKVLVSLNKRREQNA